MSETDSFIEEVTEEVKRDHLFALFRKYGWIAVLLVLMLVGGTIWNESRKASAKAEAQALGDAILVAMQQDDSSLRVAGLQGVETSNAAADALVALLIASNQDADAARASLSGIVANEDVPQIYRSIAGFRALLNEPDVEIRRTGFEALAAPGAPIALLAEEQLALIEIETDDRDAAITRLQRVIQDASVSVGLKERATQLIVALGGDPDATDG